MDDLLGLQQTIAVCLRSAFATYQDVPGVSRALRQSAVLCRSQLLENAKLLRKIEHTASSVLDIHDDLELAVDAGQSALARELVATVKGWVGGLKEAVKNVQQGNAAQMRHLHQAISEVESACEKDGYDSDCATKDGREPLPLPKTDESLHDGALDGVEDALKAATNAASAIATARRDARSASFSVQETAITPQFFPDAPAPERVFELALRQLERVDAVLERLALLWDSTEVVFDTLLQKSEHIEKFLEFAREPQPLARAVPAAPGGVQAVLGRRPGRLYFGSAVSGPRTCSRATTARTSTRRSSRTPARRRDDAAGAGRDDKTTRIVRCLTMDESLHDE